MKQDTRHCPYCNSLFLADDFGSNFNNCAICNQKICKSCLEDWICPKDSAHLNTEQKNIIHIYVEKYRIRKQILYLIGLILFIIPILLVLFIHLSFILWVVVAIPFFFKYDNKVRENIRLVASL